MNDLFRSRLNERTESVRVVIENDWAYIPINMKEYAMSIVIIVNYSDALELNAGMPIYIDGPIHVSLTNERKASMR